MELASSIVIFFLLGVVARPFAEKRRADQRYRELMHSIDGIVWEAHVGQDGYTFVSEQSYAMLGYPPEQWLQTPRFWQKLILPEDRMRLESDGLLGGDRKVDRQIEYRVQTADDRVVWIRDYIKVIPPIGTEPAKLRGIMVDITDRKQIEKNLQIAQSEMQKALNTKSEFLANISHEIRTPLNAIIGMNEIALDLPTNKEVRNCLKIVKLSADSLLSLINDVLDFSKIEAGCLELEHTDFDLRSVCENAVDLVAVLATAKKLSLELMIDDGLPREVRGDSGRLLQILLNLLSNAVKFTMTGGVKLCVGFEQTSDASIRVKFSVVDTGIGLNKAEASRLFNPFTQADSSTARKFGGSGLGLSIAKRLVEMMNGEIEVVSKKGEGSTFSFTLPLKSVAIRKNIGQKKIGELDSNTHHLDGRVLVVDDNPVNQKVLCRYLEKIGCRAEVAADGHEAIAAYRRGKFDLILMDCQMPEMDGYEATRVIRSYEKKQPNERIPILALTAHALGGDRDKCFDSGMDDYLTKPISLSSLKKSLARWLSMKIHSFEDVPRLNEPHLLELMEVDEGNISLVKEVLSICEAQSALRLKNIAEASRKNDFESLLKEVHTFKTTCHNAGIKRASAICHTMQVLLMKDIVPQGEIAALETMLHGEVQFGLEEVRKFIEAKEASLNRAA